MAFDVSQFASAGLPLGGARPSLFNVIIDTPPGVPNIGAQMAFSCRASSIPGSEISVIDQPYMGRRVPMAGTRTFAPWSINVMNDEDFKLRHAFEVWMNGINRHEANLRAQAFQTNASYKGTGTVIQLSKTGVPIRTYSMVDLWPTSLGQIELAWDNGEQIEEFSVEFRYTFWEPVAVSTTGTLAV